MKPTCFLSLKESAEFYHYEEEIEHRGIYFMFLYFICLHPPSRRDFTKNKLTLINFNIKQIIFVWFNTIDLTYTVKKHSGFTVITAVIPHCTDSQTNPYLSS